MWFSQKNKINNITTLICLAIRGAVRGGKVRTILRARRWEGAPEGETLFLPRGTLEPCISAGPHRALIGPIFTSYFRRGPGLGTGLGFSLCLYFRHPSISDEKIASLVETTWDRVATVKSGSVFSVPQQQRAISTAEEFCFKYTQ